MSEPVASANRSGRAGKVSVVGVGTVGTAVAYACLIRGSAGALALYDINAKKVHAEVLDLNHGSQFVPYCRVDGSDDIAVTADSAIVIVTAGAKQHPGQSRLDLAATNVTMAQELTDRRRCHQPGRCRDLRCRPFGDRRTGADPSGRERCWIPAGFAS